MDLNNFKKQIDSKKVDCVAFSKKHKDRKNEDLFQYYEGATWALTYVLNLLDVEE